MRHGCEEHKLNDRAKILESSAVLEKDRSIDHSSITNESMSNSFLMISHSSECLIV